jgi:2-oxo-3-hexenedioate decarboxylase
MWWGYVYDRTVYDLAAIEETFSPAGLVEPRFEPELVFRLAAAPTPGMDERALLGCVDAVAHGFEVVQSIFLGWAFTAPDAVAAYGVHGAFSARGIPSPLTRKPGSRRCQLSPSSCGTTGGDNRGQASNVLGGTAHPLAPSRRVARA